MYDRSHGDWSLSSKYKGAKPETRFMDIDSAASTPIVRFDGDLSKVEYLKYELTGLAYHLMNRSSRLHRAGHRTWRRQGSADGARLRRRPR